MRTKKLLVLAAICLLLSGCGADKTADKAGDNTLWVVTELSNRDGMNYQAKLIVKQMEEENPDLDITLDILPTDPQEREQRLTQLRTQIMSGNGPDVYLLPTGSKLVSDKLQRDDSIPVEPLIADVQQAIRNGIFLDVSERYDSDTELGKDALNQKVMEAGCFQGKRYVLPLRYNVSVIYTEPELCGEYGLTPELFALDFMSVAETVLSLEDGATAAVGMKFPENIETLGSPVDYDKGEIHLTQAQIADYLRLCRLRDQVSTQATKELYDAADYHRYEVLRTLFRDPLPTLEEYIETHPSAWPRFGETYHEYYGLLGPHISYECHWTALGMPLYTGYLSDVLENLGAVKYTGQTVDVYPIRGADGSVNASVAYWGAVGSSCEDPDLAYRFLRQFLLEDFQWEVNRPRMDKSGSPLINRRPDPQSLRMVERSLPVRTDGCVEYLWDNLQYQVRWWYCSWLNSTIQRNAVIRREEVTSEEVPYLNWEIDHVYFPISMNETESLAYAMSLLNEEDGTPTSQNIDTLAQNVWQNLWWNIAEG